METNTPQTPSEPHNPVVTGPTPSSPPPVTSTSGRAITSLILGILSLTCCGFISGIPAIILGRLEMKTIDQSGLPNSNRTLAKVGMVLGIIGTALSILYALFTVIMFALGLSGPYQNSFP